MAVGFFLLLFIPISSQAENYFMWPDSNNTVNFTKNGNASSNWEAVNKMTEEDKTDDFFKCVWTNSSSSYQYDLYNFDDFPHEGATINSIAVYAHFFTYQSGTGSARVFIRIGGTDYEGDARNIGQTASWINNNYDTNPSTSEEWTIEQLNGLTAGVEMMSASSGYAYVDSVYVDVTYTPEEEGGGNTTPPTGTIYTVPVFVNDWTGEYTTDFETYKANSQIRLFGENGPLVFISKKEFTVLTGLFGALMGAVLMWALFKAVL